MEKLINDRYPYELSVIIPSYNEEKRIGQTLKAIKNYLIKNNIKAEIIVVDDGSQDKTQAMTKASLADFNHWQLITLNRNIGKGSAIKKGVDKAQGKYLLFTDADNSAPIEELEKLKSKIENTDFDIVIGSRYLKNADTIIIKQPLYRIFLGRIGNFLIRQLLLKDIQDTQCGFKLFHNQVAKKIFAIQKVKRFGFDIEILAIAKKFNYKILEVPINWFNSTDSRLRPMRDSLITLKDLILIKINFCLNRYRQN